MYAKRDGSGNFITAAYPLIGKSGSVPSNDEGINSMDIGGFLEREFGDMSQEIYDKLNELACNFPVYLQKSYPHILFSISIDLGIKLSEDGFSIYIFKVDDAVMGDPELLFLDAKLSLEYYWYLYNN